MGNLSYIHKEIFEIGPQSNHVEFGIGESANKFRTFRDELVIYTARNDVPLIRVEIGTHDKWQLLSLLIRELLSKVEAE